METEKVKISVLKPFPNILLGARLFCELNPSSYTIYSDKKGESIALGEELKRHEVLLDVLKNQCKTTFGNYTLIVFKVVNNGLNIDTFNKYCLSTVCGDSDPSLCYCSITLGGLVKYLTEEKEEFENKEFFDKKIVDAMDRIIRIQINVPEVFSKFLKSLN